MKKTLLERYRAGGYAVYRVPGILCTEKGTLLAWYECRHGSDWSVMDMALRTSTDGGRSWDERRIIQSAEGHNVIHNGVMLEDRGVLLFLFHRNYREAFLCRSTDEGRTWSRPEDITYAYRGLRDRYHWTVAAAGPGHGLRMKNGRLVVPVWLSANPENITSHHPSVVTTLYSDDGGQSWSCGEIIPASEELVDPNESSLAETEGGVLINMRHATPVRYRKTAFSADGISGWTDIRFDRSLPDPVCFGSMTGAGGKTWFVNCASETDRVNVTVRESRDGCASWERQLCIEPLGGYADVAYHPRSRTLHVVCESGRNEEGNRGSFDLAVFSLSENELRITP